MTVTRHQLCKPWEHRLNRRQLLGASAAAGAGAIGLGAIANPAVAEQLRRKEKQMLFIWIDGGMSQLETWDPKPQTRFGGPFRTIPTNVTGVHLCELMPKIAKQMNHLAVVRSLCTQDNSHSAGVARIQRGDPKNRGVVYPYLGSAVARLLGPGASGLPPYVWIKPGSGGFVYTDAGFLGPKYGAVAFGDGKPPENLVRPETLSEQDDLDRNKLRESLNNRYSGPRRKENNEANSFVYAMAHELMKRRELFDESKFAERDVERYGRTEFGRHLLIGRRMIEAGVRFVKVNSYGWDTHGDNFNGHANLVPKVDQAFAALIEDLSASGHLENTLVVMLSEFGRTPRINGHVGRDHWPEAWSTVMAGSGIKRGVVVGKTNDEGTFVTDEQADIGHMFHTWFKALDIDPIKTQYNNNGQPLPIAHDNCKAIAGVLA